MAKHCIGQNQSSHAYAVLGLVFAKTKLLVLALHQQWKNSTFEDASLQCSSLLSLLQAVMRP